MKRRTSKPLLRASIAVVGTAMLACGGSSVAESPDEPPAEEPKPEETSDAEFMYFTVVVPDGFTGLKRNPNLYMITSSGERKGLGTMVFSGPGPVYKHRKVLGSSVAYPKVLTVGIVIDVDDDKASPSRGDLVGEVTGVVGEEFHIEAARYMPIVKAVVRKHAMTPDRDERRIKTYANTKGSHNYQPPAPIQMVQIDLEGPNDPALRKVSLRFVVGGPEADELRVELDLPRLPAEIHVEAPSGVWVPKQFEIFVDAGVGTPEHRTARMDSMQGDTVRAVLRKP